MFDSDDQQEEEGSFLPLSTLDLLAIDRDTAFHTWEKERRQKKREKKREDRRKPKQQIAKQQESRTKGQGLNLWCENF